MKELSRLRVDVENVRNGEDRAKKYALLFQSGLSKIAKKVGEEGVEIAVAAMLEDERKPLVAAESADLLCYLTALWVELGISEAEIEAALREARRKFNLQV